MAVDTLEPPVAEVKPPTLGDKFRANFEKLEHPETSDLEQAPKITVEPAKVEPEKKEEIAAKPASPLDAILSKEPEAKPAEVPDVTQEFDEKNPNWSRARKVMKTQSEQIKDYETQISQLKAEPKVDNGAVAQLTQERDQLKEQNAKYQKDIMAINAEYSDEYQDLLKSREKVLGKIGNRAKSFGVDPESVLGALELPEGRVKSQQLKDALSELDVDDKADIRAEIKSLNDTDEKIADFRKDLPSKWEEIQARKETREREQQSENLKTLETQFGKIVEELPKKVIFLREVGDDEAGAEDWNPKIRGAKERALSVLKPGGSDFQHTVEIAFKGEHYDDLADYTKKLHADYKEAMARLKEFDDSGPDFKGGKKPANEPKMTASSKYHQKLAELKGAEQD